MRTSKRKYLNRRVQQKPSLYQSIDKRKLYNILRFFSLGCLGIVGLAVISSLLFLLLIYIQRMPYFSLQHIDIKGNKRLSENRILSLAGITLGDNILRIRLGSLYERLYQSKWIKHVAIRRTLPDTLHIEIEELQASFWVQHNNTLYYAGVLGFPITPVDKEFFVSLPVLEIEQGAEDFIIHLPAIMNELQKTPYPLDVKSISWIKLLSTSTVELYIESMNITITFAIEDWQENIKKIQLVIQDLAHRGKLSKVRKIYANNVILVEI